MNEDPADADRRLSAPSQQPHPPGRRLHVLLAADPSSNAALAERASGRRTAWRRSTSCRAAARRTTLARTPGVPHAFTADRVVEEATVGDIVDRLVDVLVRGLPRSRKWAGMPPPLPRPMRRFRAASSSSTIPRFGRSSSRRMPRAGVLSSRASAALRCSPLAALSRPS